VVRAARATRAARRRAVIRAIRLATRARRAAAARPGASIEGVDEALFERLRALRRRIARERGVPPYIVFGDRTLQELAAEKPTTLSVCGSTAHRAALARITRIARCASCSGTSSPCCQPSAGRR